MTEVSKAITMAELPSIMLETRRLSVYLDPIERNASNLDLSNSDFGATTFTAFDFSNCNFSNSDLRRCVFINCKFDKTIMHGVRINQAVFEQCFLDTAIGLKQLIVNDPRKFQCFAVWNKDRTEIRIYAGCRSFNISDALDHWGDPTYTATSQYLIHYNTTSKVIGDSYINAIKNFTIPHD